jgi:hypothetical protein
MRSETEIKLIGENKLLADSLRSAYEVIKTIVGENFEEDAILHNLRWIIKYALDTHDERRLKEAE